MAKYPKIVVLTGAGISAESGVPTFRGPGGLWYGRRVEDVATDTALRRDPWGVNEFYNERRRQVGEVRPNAAHYALAQVEEVYGDNFLLVTQNIDPLHEMAGSKRVVHMHGELMRIRCEACGQNYPFIGDARVETVCEACAAAGRLRPDIVLFGEVPFHMDEITRALEACDYFTAVGTSGAIYPAAGFVDLANEAGAETIEVNNADTARSAAFGEKLTGTASEKVPELCKRFVAMVKA